MYRCHKDDLVKLESCDGRQHAVLELSGPKLRAGMDIDSILPFAACRE